MQPIVDPNFQRSVVLMLEYEKSKGALGLILNRPTDYPLAKLCEKLGIRWRGRGDACAGWGGPVQQQTGWVLLGFDAPAQVDAVSLLPGICWSRSQDALKHLAHEQPALPGRVCLGCAGWAPGQLEHEIMEGAWLVAPLDRSLIFECDAEAMWEQAVRLLGVNPATLVSSRGVN